MVSWDVGIVTATSFVGPLTSGEEGGLGVGAAPYESPGHEAPALVTDGVTSALQ